MADIKLDPREGIFSWTLPTGEHHRLIVQRLGAALVEMEDLHFHFDSAVMMPDRTPADAVDAKSGCELTSLSVIRACYLYASENPDKKLLALGHTDRSGPPDSNVKLAKLRAQNIWAVMMGKQDEWTSICAQRHVVQDYQLILKWISNIRYWPECDPGRVDGDHGNGTSKALRAFKKRYNDAFGGTLADSADIDKPTWEAFFKMYMVGLSGLMQTDESGLDAHRQGLTWMSPAWDGCGECHPITEDVAANYRSRVDRRVELLFFDAGEEPRLGACHPSADARAPEECELYRKTYFGLPFYRFEPVAVATNAKVALRLTEVRGLYKPGFSDPADVKKKTEKLSGYSKAYKSEDDLGRIFVNQIPRVDASVSWDDVKKKNQQYIELSATIDVKEGTLPPDAQVVWTWEDPDDPSDTDMRDDAAAFIDPNDFENGKRVAKKGDDNNGDCDFPTEGASKEPAFEQIGPYALTPGEAGSKTCFTLISGGKSEVRFHCTDAGGDNFRIKATVKAAPGLMVTAGDQTGTMTMWKRIDVEHRRMKDAESIPAKEIAPFFEKQFVQMDVGEEELTTNNDPYIKPRQEVPQFVEKEFKNKGKPGWFFICVAQELEKPAGRVQRSLYEGPAKLITNPPLPLVVPKGRNYFPASYLPQGESVVIDAVLKERPFVVTFSEGGKTLAFFAGKMQPDSPKGKTTIALKPIDFQSDFEPADGSQYEAYAKRVFYFPRFRYRWPEKVWEKKGYGFPDAVYVNVVSFGASPTAGISPGVIGPPPASDEYFAGRVVIFCRHPSYTKPPSARIKVEGVWTRGDEVGVTIDGIAATYQVQASDVTIPPGVSDPGLFVRGRVALGIEDAINMHKVLRTRVSARARFGEVSLKSSMAGTVGAGTPISVLPDVASGGPGVLTLSTPVLVGGGFYDEAKREIVHVLTHELGHAFGFPHKCGYHTFETAPGTSCTMNYFHNWLYKLGTHLDPAARQVERFGPGKTGNHFCAHHTLGIRLVRLEKNTAIWKW